MVGLLAARRAVEHARAVELQLHRVGLDRDDDGLLRDRVHQRRLVARLDRHVAADGEALGAMGAGVRVAVAGGVRVLVLGADAARRLDVAEGVLREAAVAAVVRVRRGERAHVAGEQLLRGERDWPVAVWKVARDRADALDRARAREGPAARREGRGERDRKVSAHGDRTRHSGCGRAAARRARVGSAGSAAPARAHQQLPHSPWLATGDTTFSCVQSTKSGIGFGFPSASVYTCCPELA